MSFICILIKVWPGSEAGRSGYITKKNIFHRCVLPGGRFILIPSTYNPGETTDFFLRLFTHPNANVKGVKELTEDKPVLSWPRSLHCKPPSLVTRLNIVGITNVEALPMFQGR